MTREMDRRTLLGGAAMLALMGLLGFAQAGAARGRRPPAPFQLTDAQWRARLTSGQYAVLRQAATERPGSSPLNREHRRGIFHCAGCDQSLFSSAAKYDSGTGWPSFWQPLPRAIGTSIDHEIGVARTEVHCARCGGHLGHVFDDGPRPTGKRYCMNGVALRFVPA